MKSIAKYVESYGFFRVAFQEAVVLMAFFSLYFTKGYSLYFADFDFSLNRVESLLLGMATAIAIPLLVETNPRFRGGMGVFIETVLTLEFMCFYLFAQYHFWVAAVLIVGAVVGLFLLTRHIFLENKKTEKMTKELAFWCWHRSSSLVAYGLCIVLAVPAFLGYCEEYEKDFRSSENWDDFVEWYEQDSAADDESDFDKIFPYADKIKGLLEWDSISAEEKERVVRAVAMIEKEHLGIDSNVEIRVYTDKMQTTTYGYYLDDSNQIVINYQHLNEGELEDVLVTVLHEMHHAFVYDTINSLDFGSPQVKNSYFYKRAREWKENSENYISSSSDYWGYYGQPIEKDAREYSELRVSHYLLYINHYSQDNI